MRVNKLIEQILTTDMQSRDSDRRLMLIVWHKLGLVLTPEQRELFMILPSTETIRRVRQKLQETGKYPAQAHVKHERYMKYLVMQQNIPQAKPERVESLIQERLI
jgi:hypothetical protein